MSARARADAAPSASPSVAPNGANERFTAELAAGLFAEAVGRAAPIAPSKTTIPIVTHLRLSFDQAGETLSIAATDLDRGIAVETEAKGSGAICAPAAKLAQIAGKLDMKQNVRLTASEAALTVAQGRASWRLAILPAADFPDALVLALEDAEARWEAPAHQFAEALRRVEGAIDPTEPRYYLNGVYLDFLQGAAVATDGRKLGVEPTAGMPEAAGIIIPAAAIRTIADACKGRETVRVAATKNALSIEAEGLRLRTKLVDGTFPDYRRIIPGDGKMRLLVERDVLLGALDRAGLVEGDIDEGTKKGNRVTGVKLTARKGDKGGELTVECRNLLGEQASDTVPCDLVDCEAFEWSAQVKFVAWGASSFGEADTLELATNGIGEPCVITRVGDKDKASLRLLAGMRLRW